MHVSMIVKSQNCWKAGMESQ